MRNRGDEQTRHTPDATRTDSTRERKFFTLRKEIFTSPATPATGEATRLTEVATLEATRLDDLAALEMARSGAATTPHIARPA